MFLRDLLNSSNLPRETADPPGGGTAPPVVPPVVPPAVDAWTTGLDADLLGHAQNKGWHDKSPAEAAREVLKAHRAAEALIGLPADRVLKLPKDASDEAGWKEVWAKLGKPADPKEYDFSTVKVGEAPLSEAQADFLRTQASALNLSKDGALQLAQAFAKREADAGVSSAADLTAKMAEEKAALAQNWGANAEANLFIAKQTALKLGVTPEQVATLEGTLGYSKVMEMFRSIGQKIGEDRFVSNGSDFNKGLMTREQAVARKAELMRDEAFTKRYMNGDAAANREMQALLTIMVGDDTGASRYA